MEKKVSNLMRIRIILVLAFFNFVFLGTEYLFDTMARYVTTPKKVVFAQSYALGASVIGFFLFPLLNQFIKQKLKYIFGFAGVVVSGCCFYTLLQHQTYKSVILSGCLFFILAGIAGGAAHYVTAKKLEGDGHLAKTVSAGYAAGLLLQFLNHNLVSYIWVEFVILFVAFVLCAILTIDLEQMNYQDERPDKEQKQQKNPIHTATLLVICIALISCIFTTLDNVVTLGFAKGSMDIGHWPRLFLGISGLLAGFLFDLRERSYMNIIMYCITLLSTICLLIIESNGSFLIGLIVFYVASGFFVIFFSTAFMDLSPRLKTPELWAGMGRALNNLVAIATGPVFAVMLESKDSIWGRVIILVLFVLISVCVFVMSNLVKKTDTDKNESYVVEDMCEKIARFSEVFSLTKRETDVLEVLLTSDDNMQNIANQLFISRAVLYRHIASLNEKTNTNSRIGLIQFYYTWQ